MSVWPSQGTPRLSPVPGFLLGAHPALQAAPRDPHCSGSRQHCAGKGNGRPEGSHSRPLDQVCETCCRGRRQASQRVLHRHPKVLCPGQQWVLARVGTFHRGSWSPCAGTAGRSSGLSPFRSSHTPPSLLVPDSPLLVSGQASLGVQPLGKLGRPLILPLPCGQKTHPRCSW